MCSNCSWVHRVKNSSERAEGRRNVEEGCCGENTWELVRRCTAEGGGRVQDWFRRSE